jgi:cysteine desulfurase
VNSNRIYLDCAATTPIRAEVITAMREAAADSEYNPSSLHTEGRRAATVLDAARQRVAAVLKVRRNEIVFTSSGTEANNLALLGVARAARPGAHILSTAIEHHAVLSTLDRLREEGCEVTVLPIGREGRIDIAEFEAALRPTTILASVMYANNEVGTVQPIAELARLAHARGVLFHSDAVQAPGWLPLEVGENGADLLSLSAHKCEGPKGIGVLCVRYGTPLNPILYGGSQEFGHRPGTPNVLGIAGAGVALELAAAERVERSPRVARLRDRLESGIRAAVPDVRVNGTEPRLANNLNVSFAGADSASLLIALDLAGIAVSAGSACASGSLEASHVLAGMGLEPRWRRGAVRFSLGPTTSAAEIDRVLAVLPPIVAQHRYATPALRGDG